LLELITKHVATKRLVNRGSADEPVWESELCPFAPSDRALKALLTGTVQEGLAGRPLAGDGLLGRVPKA